MHSTVNQRRKYRIEIEIGIAVEIENSFSLTASRFFICTGKPAGCKLQTADC